MRFRRLDLERYGPFTGKSLAFRPGAALHLVYGRNEAGKSSALAAITDLLFGFEARSRANFLHRHEDLRVGAELELPGGEVFAFRRRKGTRNTLIDAGNTALDEALLDPLLGGVSREVFTAAFGLSREGLREGARKMLEAHGEIGESLFAAASGARSLIGVRDQLNADADLLFGQRRSSKRAFYEAQDRYDDARKELRERSLRAETLKTLAETIAGHEARIAAIKTRLTELAGERARLARLGRVGPILRRIDGLDAEIAALGPLPAVAADFPARVEATLARDTTCRETLTRLDAEVAATREAIAAIAVDDAVLAAGEEIQGLADDKAALAKAQADLTRRLADKRSLDEEVMEHVRRLGLADKETLHRLQPDDLLIERARGLIEQRRQLQLQAETAAKALARATEEVATLERAQAQAGPVLDVEPLRRRLAALRPALADTAALAEKQAALQQREAVQGDRLARLFAPSGAADQIWQRPLPSEEAIAAHEAQAAAHAAGKTQAHKEIGRLRALVAAAEQDVATRLAATEALDADVLAAYRHRRDASFDALLATPEAALIQRYREEVAKADRLADARLARADEVAQRDNAGRQLAVVAAEQAKAQAALGEIDAELAHAAAAWTALFAPFGVEPGPPGEMRRWLAAVRQLREDRQALASETAVVGGLAARLEAERPALEDLARAAGLAQSASSTTATLLREVEDRLALLASSGEEAGKTAMRLDAASAARTKALAAHEEARAALAAFEPDWQRLTQALGLDAAAASAESTKALDLWQSVGTKLALLANTEHRIKTIRDDEAPFAERVRALAARIAPDAPPDPFAAVAALQGLLVRQTQAQTRRSAITDQLTQLDTSLAAARAGAGQVEAMLDGLALEGGAPRESLAAQAQALRQRAGLVALLAEARRDLAGQGDGVAEVDLRTALAGMDPDTTAALGQAIEAEQTALTEEDKACSLDLRDLRRQRDGYETASGAAQAAQQLQDARADLERIARDYLVLKAAALLIGTGVERQVRAQQDPLIDRAGALFARITEAAFAGIAVTYDGQDELRLAALRRDGGTVAVDGLSEGTCDQLYLSLRLASLEAVAGRRSVPPFIGDDLVVTFDEPRVAATLDTLAASGRSLQVILFSHHRHVVDIARERLGATLDLIHL